MRIHQIAAMTCVLAGCGVGTDSSELDRSEVPASVSDTARLGQGYNTLKKSLLNSNCVIGQNKESIGNTKAEIVISKDQTFTQQIDKLNGKLSVDVDFPAIRAGASATYGSETAASETISTYNFDWQITPKKRSLHPFSEGRYKLSQYGSTVATSLKDRSVDLCGDEFITEIEYGASLNVTMKVEYKNESDKLDIGGKLDVDVASGKVDVKGELNFLDSNIKNSVKIEIRATQKGGDPLELLQIIPDGALTCTLDNPKLCFDAFENAIKYAKNELPKQFGSLDKYNVIKYKTESYLDSGVVSLEPSRGYPTVNVLVENLRTELDENFGNALVDSVRARKLLSSYSGWLSTEDAVEIRNLKEKAEKNANYYSRAAVYCYDNPYQECIDNYNNNIKDLIQPYNRFKLSVKAKSVSYFQICENAREAATETVPERLTKGYRNKGFAPIFANPAKPENGVNVWAPCEDAVETYGEHFKE